MLEELKAAVCQANIELQRRRLVLYSWGNVSGIDRRRGLVAIKPSGVSYDALTPADIVVVDLDGGIVDGRLKPSSDTATHLELYKHFDRIAGVCHTHSRYATMWAQACRPLPCLGTTHADSFYGEIPVTAAMTPGQIESGYEAATGRVIVERFAQLDPMAIPAVLVAAHGPFTWGGDAAGAVENAVVLEEVARMALGTLHLNPHQNPLSPHLLDKHYLRKHGRGAYYGQNQKD